MNISGFRIINNRESTILGRYGRNVRTGQILGTGLRLTHQCQSGLDPSMSIRAWPFNVIPGLTRNPEK
ncbi:MAG: hypothetical protein K8R53_03425 [Bacteroidales bacterium]|nr:hypothetical protein [Bacteroidales bacterium]